MSQTVGDINLKLSLNKNEYKKSLNTVKSESSSTASALTSIFSKAGTAIAAAFSVSLAKSLGQKLTTAAATVQAANSQFSQTFGSLADSASDAMEKVASKSGIVKTRLQGVGTSIYAFAKTTGMDSANALSMMREALEVTADSAAYYDRSLEDTAESLKSFLKGNYANDAALGLSCTETTRNTAANKLYGKSFKDLSEAQKQLTLLQMVKDANAASGALGQAARESDGLENVLGNLKETWNQFLAVVGKPVLKGAVVVIQNITTVLSKLTDAAKVAVGELGKLFGWEEEDSTSGAAAANAQAISDSVDNQKALTEETKKTNEEVKRGVASFDRLNIISQTAADDDSSDSSADAEESAAAVTTAATAAEKAAGSAGSKLSDRFRQIFKDFYVRSGFKGFVDKVQNGINTVNWDKIRANCESSFKKLVPISKTYLEKAQKVGSSALGALGSATGMFITIGGKAFETFSGGVDRWLTRDSRKIQGFINRTGDNFAKGFENLSTVFDGLGAMLGSSIDKVRPETEEAIARLFSGLTSFFGGIGELISGTFAVSTQSLSDWISRDGATITEFFTGLQRIGNDVYTVFGDIFGDVGDALSGWWNGDGAAIFKNICDAFNNVGTTLMNVWNNWIMPAWSFIKGAVQDAWNNALSPVFTKLLNFFGKLGNLIALVWNKYLSPLVNWLVEKFGPIFTNIFNAIGSVFQTAFSIIGGVIGGIIDYFSGIIDFLTGVFSGDWDLAWKGIKDSFEGICNAIGSIFKGVCNGIIDALNLLWTGIYSAAQWIVNGVGDMIGAIGSAFGQDWSFSMPSEPPLIPKLASGGIVKAPTLALVGEYAGASSNPEVIAPLNKLQSMLPESGGSELAGILDYLKRIYELFVIFRNQGGSVYEFAAELNGNELFREIVRQNEMYKKSHNGRSAFA